MQTDSGLSLRSTAASINASPSRCPRKIAPRLDPGPQFIRLATPVPLESSGGGPSVSEGGVRTPPPPRCPNKNGINVGYSFSKSLWSASCSLGCLKLGPVWPGLRGRRPPAGKERHRTHPNPFWDFSSGLCHAVRGGSYSIHDEAAFETPPCQSLRGCFQ